MTQSIRTHINSGLYYSAGKARRYRLLSAKHIAVAGAFGAMLLIGGCAAPQETTAGASAVSATAAGSASSAASTAGSTSPAPAVPASTEAPAPEAPTEEPAVPSVDTKAAETVAAPAPAAVPAPAAAPVTEEAPVEEQVADQPAAAPSGYGCDAAIAYLRANAHPAFSIICPGYAFGGQAVTCLNHAPQCPNSAVIIINVPCPTAYMNEAANSFALYNSTGAAIDPYGATC